MITEDFITDEEIIKYKDILYYLAGNCDKRLVDILLEEDNHNISDKTKNLLQTWL